MLASQTASALIDVLLPSDCPEADRPAMMAAAHLLVKRRIAGLALPMQIAVCVLLVLFQWLALPLTGQLFSHASLQKRRDYAMRAEQWKLIPFRELVRLVRSLTLLAFYDHPLTRRRLEFIPGGMQRSFA